MENPHAKVGEKGLPDDAAAVVVVVVVVAAVVLLILLFIDWIRVRVVMVGMESVGLVRYECWVRKVSWTCQTTDVFSVDVDTGDNDGTDSCCGCCECCDCEGGYNCTVTGRAILIMAWDA